MKTLKELLETTIGTVGVAIYGANTGGRGHNVELKRPEPLKLKDKKQKPFIKKKKKKKESQDFEKGETHDHWLEHGGQNEPW